MKLSKLMAMLLMLSSLSFAVACKTQEEAEVEDADETATTATEQEAAGTAGEGTSDLNPIEAQTSVDDVTIGKTVNADGMIAPENQGDDFAPGDSVNLAMNVADAAAGSAVKVVWYGPGETKIAEEEKTVETGAKYLTFQAADTASWAKGDYRAEVWIGDEKVNTQQFQIVDAAGAGR